MNPYTNMDEAIMQKQANRLPRNLVRKLHALVSNSRYRNLVGRSRKADLANRPLPEFKDELGWVPTAIAAPLITAGEYSAGLNPLAPNMDKPNIREAALATTLNALALKGLIRRNTRTGRLERIPRLRIAGAVGSTPALNMFTNTFNTVQNTNATMGNVNKTVDEATAGLSGIGANLEQIMEDASSSSKNIEAASGDVGDVLSSLDRAMGTADRLTDTIAPTAKNIEELTPELRGAIASVTNVADSIAPIVQGVKDFPAKAKGMLTSNPYVPGGIGAMAGVLAGGVLSPSSLASDSPAARKEKEQRALRNRTLGALLGAGGGIALSKAFN